MAATPRDEAVYRQIQEEIVSDILCGIYPVGECIRGQEYYAQRFSVSRTTVRKALDELIERGLLYTVKGKGTYVKGRVEFFSTSAAKAEVAEPAQPFFKLLQLQVTRAPDRIAKQLGVVQNTPVVCITRVKYVSNAPSNYQSSYLNPELVQEVDFAAEDLETGSLYRLLINKAQLRPQYSDEIIRAVGCPARVAPYFKAKTGEPVLFIARTTRCGDGSVMEYCEDYIYTAVNGLKRRNGHKDEANGK